MLQCVHLKVIMTGSQPEGSTEQGIPQVLNNNSSTCARTYVDGGSDWRLGVLVPAHEGRRQGDRSWTHGQRDTHTCRPAAGMSMSVASAQPFCRILD
jgi:hypothetical protein